MHPLEDQFENYYNEYLDMVYALCLGYSKGDSEQANDLVQETFVNLWNALSKFQGKSSPKTWIYRICVNTCLLQIRKNKRRKAELLQVEHTGMNDESKQDHHYQELYQAIGQLKEVDRMIIMLVLDDLPYLEIAEIMGITKGNLRVKISRAKRQLKTILRHGR